MRKLIIFSLFIASFALGIGISLQYQNQQNTLSDHTLLFPQAKKIPEFSVLDHTAQTVGNEVLQGRWSLMFFGFTHCPDVCPNTLSILAELQKRMADSPNTPQLVLVSVDPMRDTPEIMNTYINSFSDDIIGLTGELHQIQVLTEALGVAYAYNALPDGSYTVDHTAAVFIFNPDGDYAGLYTGSLAAQDALKFLSKDFQIMSNLYGKK